MSRTRAGLVRAVLADPDADAPRLVFADWFEENGDPSRAEFIRTQIERSNLTPDDPRQSELEAHELRLLAAHAKAWCGSHFAFKKVRFRRGFIEYVHLHLQHFLHHRRQLFALEPVRDVSLTGWLRATDDLVRRVAACEELQFVETLRVHHQGPHKEPRSNLVILLESPHLTGLRSLRVPRLAFDGDARRRFERAAAVGGLEHLTLPSLETYPTDPGPWWHEGGPPHPWQALRSFRFTDPQQLRGLLPRLVAEPFWDQLRVLDLPYDQNAPDLIRDHLPPGLEELSLRSHSFGPDPPPTDALLRAVARLPLRRLHLNGVSVTPASLEALLDPAGPVRLEELSLTGCRPTDDGVRTLAAAASLNGLRALTFMEFPGPLPDAMAALLGSPHLRSLVRLELACPAVGPRLAAALAGNGWPHLRTLGLGLRNVPSTQLRELFGSPTFRPLVRLSLTQWHQGPQPFPPDVAAGLLELPHLASLHVTGFERDDALYRTLRSAERLPWLSVEWAQGDGMGHFEPDRLPPRDEDLSELDRWA